MKIIKTIKDFIKYNLLELDGWRAEKYGKEGMVVDKRQVVCLIDNRFTGDRLLHESGNYFKTERHAERIKRQLINKEILSLYLLKNSKKWKVEDRRRITNRIKGFKKSLKNKAIYRLSTG